MLFLVRYLPAGSEYNEATLNSESIAVYDRSYRHVYTMSESSMSESSSGSLAAKIALPLKFDFSA